MKRLVIAAAVVLLALPLFAQQQPNKDFQIFAYASDLTVTHTSSRGTTADAGFGLAVSKFVAPHVSMELSVSSQTWYEYEPIYVGPEAFLTYRRDSRHTWPVTLDGQYHFFTDSRWKPYLGAGLRYVNASATTFHADNRIRPEITGGVEFMMTPALSLRFDGKQELESNGPVYDPATRVSVGIGWHF